LTRVKALLLAEFSRKEDFMSNFITRTASFVAAIFMAVAPIVVAVNIPATAPVYTETFGFLLAGALCLGCGFAALVYLHYAVTGDLVPGASAKKVSATVIAAVVLGTAQGCSPAPVAVAAPVLAQVQVLPTSMAVGEVAKATSVTNTRYSSSNQSVLVVGQVHGLVVVTAVGVGRAQVIAKGEDQTTTWIEVK